MLLGPLLVDPLVDHHSLVRALQVIKYDILEDQIQEKGVVMLFIYLQVLIPREEDIPCFFFLDLPFSYEAQYEMMA